jgi:hypothetical protein
MVLAPFITSVDYPPTAKKANIVRPVQTGIMVNVGWVPLDKKNEISTDPPVEEKDLSEIEFDLEEGILIK